MSNIFNRTLVAILIAAILCLFDFSVNSSKAEAQVFKDPLLEYSYHIKFDLAWLKGFTDKLFDAHDTNPSQAKKLNEIFNIIEKTGIADMENITIDFRLDNDRFVGTTKIMLKTDEIKSNLIRDIVSIPPRASVVRALIPEEKTLAWISIMDPIPLIDLLDEYMFKQLEINKGSYNLFKNGPMGDWFTKCHDLLGDESHLVIFNIEGFNDIYPKPYFAVIIEMKDGLKDKELNTIKDAFRETFVDTYGGKMTKGNCKGRFETIIFEDFGCPLDIKPSLIIDKNYMIFATYPETLDEAAGYILTPQRTAQGLMPQVMNAMITVNLDKLIKNLPSYVWSTLSQTGMMEKSMNITSAIKEENWGTFQLIKTHISNGVLIDFSMDKSTYAFMFTIWNDSMKSEIQKSILSINNLEHEVMANLRSIQVVVERYYIDHKRQYPSNIKELVNLGYIGKFPINPYTEREMKPVKFEHRSKGDFTYIPIKDTKNDLIYGYYLICYGEPEMQYDKVDNEALMKDGIINEIPDGVPDDVLLILGQTEI